MMKSILLGIFLVGVVAHKPAPPKAHHHGHQHLTHLVGKHHLTAASKNHSHVAHHHATDASQHHVAAHHKAGMHQHRSKPKTQQKHRLPTSKRSQKVAAKRGLRGQKHQPRVQKLAHHKVAKHEQHAKKQSVTHMHTHTHAAPQLMHHLFAKTASTSAKRGGVKCHESEDVEMGDLKECDADEVCFVRYKEDTEGVKLYFRRFCTMPDTCVTHDGETANMDEWYSYAESDQNVFYKCCNSEGCNGPVPATIPGTADGASFYITSEDGKCYGPNAEGAFEEQDDCFLPSQQFLVKEESGDDYKITVSVGETTYESELSTSGSVATWQITRLGLSTYRISGMGNGGPENMFADSVSLVPATPWDIVIEGGTCGSLKDAGYRTLSACTLACDQDEACVGAVAWPADAFSLGDDALCTSPMVCKCDLVTGPCGEEEQQKDENWNVYKHKCAGVTCAALDQCHAVGVCSRETGECDDPTMADGTGCNDNDENTVEDVCTAGVCAGENRCAGVVCEAKNQCYDVGTCDKWTGTCSEPMKSISTSCDDDDAGTISDQCVSGACVGQDRCDGVACEAMDQCHVVGECDRYTGTCSDPVSPLGTECDDGAENTVQDACTNEGVCLGVDLCANVECSAKDQCHAVGTCDYQTGQCHDPFMPEGTTCDDGNEITVSDVCNGQGACAGQDLCAGVTCIDKGSCFSDGVCNYLTGSCEWEQKAEGDPCNDENRLTIEDTCDAAGLCSGRGRCEDVTCSALEPQCHLLGTCDPENGKCSNPTKDEGTVCNDGNERTFDDTCDASGSCGGTLKCDGVTCDSPDECQEPGACQWQTGECLYPTSEDGTSCDDGADNTVEDICSAGSCAGVDKCADVTCEAASDCHEVGTCDKHTGVCSVEFKSDGETCDDGSGYTKNDKCNGAGVCAGEKLCVGVVCEASDQCHDVGICNDLTGECNDPIKADGSTCDDENEETVEDVCNLKVSESGEQSVECAGVDLCAEVTCEALDQCHEAGECDHKDGSCSNPQKSDGTDCDDGNPFTDKDKCTLGGCAGEQIIHCEKQLIEIGGDGETFAKDAFNKDPVDFACAEGEVITSARMVHANVAEDSTFEFGCSAVSTGTEQCVYTTTSLANADFSESCEAGFALSGVEARYEVGSGGAEDRVYRFLCCKITDSVEVLDEEPVACDGGDGDACNAVDKSASFTLGGNQAVTKMESTYDSLRVSRVWKFAAVKYNKEVCADCTDPSCLPK